MKQKRLSLLFCIVYGVAVLGAQFTWAYNLSWPYSVSSELAEHNKALVDDTLLYLAYQKHNLGTLELQLTPKEASHMEDVKLLFGVHYVIMLQSLIIFAILSCCIAVTDRTHRKLWLLLKKSSYLLAGITLALTIFLAVFFKPLFLLFHKFAFSNNDWLLPRDAVLIQLFPEQTFLLITAITLLSTAAIHLLLGLSMTYADTHTKRKTQ